MVPYQRANGNHIHPPDIFTEQTGGVLSSKYSMFWFSSGIGMLIDLLPWAGPLAVIKLTGLVAFLTDASE